PRRELRDPSPGSAGRVGAGDPGLRVRRPPASQRGRRMSDDALSTAVGPEAAGKPRPVVLTSRPPERPTALRAWWYLVRLSVQRQSRSHHMLWVALILLGLTATIVLLNTAANRWGMYHWRSPRGSGPTFDQYWERLQAV